MNKLGESVIGDCSALVKSFFSLSLEMLCISSLDGKFLKLNNEWERTLGYSLSELEGCYYSSFVHPDDIVSTGNALQELEHGQSLFNFTNRYRCKDGSYKWIEWRAIKDEAYVFAAARDISDKIDKEQIITHSELIARNRLKAVLDPDTDISKLTLAEMVDVGALTSIARDFHSLVGIPCGIIDVEGNVLVAIGWQDVCMKYHRTHPDTLKNCIESDTILSSNVAPGTYRAYRCKNNLWDLVTPIIVGDKHVGNIFLGQFMYDDEEPDDNFFSNQAQRYGFDEEDYLKALHCVPRCSREKVDAAMAFYGKLSGLLSNLSFSTMKLAKALNEKEQADLKYQTLFNEMLDGFALHEVVCNDAGEPIDYRFLAVNPAFERMTGFEYKDIARKRVLDVMPQTEHHWISTFGQVALTGEPVHFENYAQELGKYFEVTAYRPAPNQFACLFVDITARKKAEAEKEKLREQLNQAQKIESIGRLAGGVAHDFNNMLSIIVGHAQFMQDDIDEQSPLYESINEIIKAGKRSTELTRQLLAFARKQTILPQVLDLNETLQSMMKMLDRLIGEDVSLIWKPGTDLGSIMIDPSQLDQILANLCINARDAISNVGEIVIETSDAVFTDDNCKVNEGITPGEYVMLAVSDNGCGIHKEDIPKLFEPFFTTKETGKGTGLGLSTVHGIVKQNNGCITVYSEVGVGTTFKVYLPRYHGSGKGHRDTDSSAELRLGKGTILIVDDEPAIVRLVKRMAEKLGYRVLEALSPNAAIRMAREHLGAIDLMISDVIMPEMNGKDLMNYIRTIYPNIGVVFMSGYTSNVIAHHNILDDDMHFISKPFTIKELSHTISEAIKQ